MTQPNIDGTEIVKAQRIIDAASDAIMTYAKLIGLPIRSAYVSGYGDWAEVRLDGHHRLFKNCDGKRSLTCTTLIIKGSSPYSQMIEAAEAFKAKKRQ